jgi:hypothetical protein
MLKRLLSGSIAFLVSVWACSANGVIGYLVLLFGFPLNILVVGPYLLLIYILDYFGIDTGSGYLSSEYEDIVFCLGFSVQAGWLYGVAEPRIKKWLAAKRVRDASGQ